MKKRDRRNLGLLIIMFVPCGLIYFLVDEEMNSRKWLLLTVIAGWGLSAAYSLVVNRSLVQDVAPFLLLPFGLIRGIKFIIVGIFSIGGWVGNAIKWIFGIRKREWSFEGSTPPDWDILVRDEAVGRKLLSGRHAVLGYNEKRVLFIDWGDTEHLIITGVTQYGKTTISWSIILSMLLQGPSALDKMEFSIHDPKGVFGLHFRPLEDVYPDQFQVYTRAKESRDALKDLVEEMTDRTHRLGQKRVLTVDELGLRHKLIVIDEPQLWYGRKEIKDYEDLVMELVTAGAQAGFHILMMTPYAKADVISTRYRVNFKRITSRLPKHAIRSMDGFEGADQLRKYEFLYQEDEADPPVFFRTYQIRPDHIEWAVGNALYSPHDAEDIAVYLFVTKPGCGIRTMLREGIPHCQSLVTAGRLKSVPFPWREVGNGGGEFRPTGAAWEWGKTFFQELEEAGIASPAQHGQARELVVSGLTEALAKWKLYKENGHETQS
jgi:hypothetical protein